MATLYWTGNAHSVRQINTITVANTWAANDTATITINGKDLVVTCGSTTTTTATVATAIKEAWMAAGRLDGTSSSSNATSNFGGQDFGEFREMTATASGSVVTLTGTIAGKPITLAVTESTSGTGTATLATSQAATGKWHWDNGDNWSGGSVPANDDVVVFKENDISCRYGLPNASLEVTIEVWRSFTGEVGLPAINRDDPSYPYPEYRQRYVRLDDAGTGTNIAHRFGLGQDGVGCRLFNLKHSTVKCSPIVYWTATPLAERAGAKALNICCTANTSTLNIVNGSVDYSSQDGSTSAFVAVTQTDGDSRGINAMHTTNSIVEISGGTAVAGSTTTVTLYRAFGTGRLRIENHTGTLSGITCNAGGTVEYASSATIAALAIDGGTFDARPGSGTFTITAASYWGGTVIDPYQRITTTNFVCYADPGPNLQLGANRSTGVTLSF